jgi:hypothetical protein
MNDNRTRIKGLRFTVVATLLVGSLWAIIEIKGIHTGPHGEIGGLQVLELIVGIASGLGWLNVLVQLIAEVFTRPHPLRQPARALGATLNVFLILCSIMVLFSTKGLIARMHASFVDVERDFNQEVNEDPGQHVCIDGGKPATKAVVYGGNPGIIRWYCDPSRAPRFIEVPSSEVPVPQNAPVNFLLYAVVLIAQFSALVFATTLFGHVVPFAVPRLAQEAQEYWARQFEFGSSKDSFGGGLLVAYIITITNLVMWFLPAPLFPLK